MDSTPDNQVLVWAEAISETAGFIADAMNQAIPPIQHDVATEIHQKIASINSFVDQIVAHETAPTDGAPDAIVSGMTNDYRWELNNLAHTLDGGRALNQEGLADTAANVRTIASQMADDQTVSDEERDALAALLAKVDDTAAHIAATYTVLAQIARHQALAFPEFGDGDAERATRDR